MLKWPYRYPPNQARGAGLGEVVFELVYLVRLLGRQEPQELLEHVHQLHVEQLLQGRGQLHHVTLRVVEVREQQVHVLLGVGIPRERQPQHQFQRERRHRRCENIEQALGFNL